MHMGRSNDVRPVRVDATAVSYSVKIAASVCFVSSRDEDFSAARADHRPMPVVEKSREIEPVVAQYLSSHCGRQHRAEKEGFCCSRECQSGCERHDAEQASQRKPERRTSWLRRQCLSRELRRDCAAFFLRRPVDPFDASPFTRRTFRAADRHDANPLLVQLTGALVMERPG